MVNCSWFDVTRLMVRTGSGTDWAGAQATGKTMIPAPRITGHIPEPHRVTRFQCTVMFAPSLVRRLSLAGRPRSHGRERPAKAERSASKRTYVIKCLLV